jgi:hypothetical protein
MPILLAGAGRVANSSVKRHGCEDKKVSDEKFKQEYIDYYRRFDREGVITTPRGLVAGLIGLGAELYVEPRDRLQLRMDMLDVQEDYWLRFGKFMDRMYVLSDDEPDGKTVKLKPGENPALGVRQLTGERWSKDLTYVNTLIHTFKHPN